MTGLLVAGALAACGGTDMETDTARPAPPATEFPSAAGHTLGELVSRAADSDLVVSPAGRVADVGLNRFAFGVFALNGEQVDDADIALYFARGFRGRAKGPFPAAVESLETPSAFRSKTTADDPDSATSVYVVPRVRLEKAGEWTMLALIRIGEKMEATRLPSVIAGQFSGVPDVGDRPPRVHTPTQEDVGEISEIETRIPPDTMHEIDFAEVLGQKPTLLVFATPQLCQSRVCGPSVDIAEQVKSEFGDKAAFIHMEVYNENDPSKGLRPQLRAFNLPTEPWAFVFDRAGVITARLEGAFGARELTAALNQVTD